MIELKIIKNYLVVLIEYPPGNFFEMVKYLKGKGRLELVGTETQQINEDNSLTTVQQVSYKDSGQEILIRISENSISIDFFNFKTINMSLNAVQYKKIIANNFSEIRITFLTNNNNEYFSFCIIDIKKYLIRESISRLSEYQIKRVLEGKRTLKSFEVNL
jgi:hypothetical protein